MAALSDLIGGGTGGNAPDAAATLLTRVQSNKCWWEYKPAAALAPGKYVVKVSHDGRQRIRVSTDKGDYAEVVHEDSAVIDITSATNNLQVSLEPFDIRTGPIQQYIPRYYPGLNANVGASTSRLYNGRRMMACDPTGQIWIQVRGHQGTVFRSTDFGRTWLDLGRPDQLAGVANTFYDTYCVIYALGRFIIYAGPAETTIANGVTIASTNGYTWSRIATNGILTGVIDSATNSLTNPSNISSTGVNQVTEGPVVVGARWATTNNVVYSTDGVNFVQQSVVGFTGNAWFVDYFPTYGSGTFIMTDNANHIITSTDGISWAATITIPFNARNIALIGSTFYAVSQAGQIYSSTNLTTWTLLVTLSNNAFNNHLLWNRGSLLFYFDPTNGLVRTSTDGVTWASRVNMTNDASLFLGNNYFWVWDQNNAYRSEDGINWTFRNAASGGNNILASAAGQANFVTGGATSITTSPFTDTVFWTGRTNPVAGSIRDMEYNTSTSTFLLVTDNGRIATSADDGINWAAVNNPWAGSVAATGTGFNGSRWVVVGNSGTQVLLSTDNGVSFTAINLTASTGQNMNGVTFTTSNRWFAVGNAGTMAFSTDNGSSWTTMPTTRWRTFWGGKGAPPTLAWNSIAFGNNTIVAVGDRQIAYSKDNGDTWYYRDQNSFISNVIIQDVKFAAGRFVASCRGGLVLYSTDGIDWFSLQSGFNTTNVNSYTFGGGVHLLTGDAGVQRISSDGLNFITPVMTFIPSTTYCAVSAGGTKNVAFGNNGIWITNDFEQWELPVTNNVGGGNNLVQGTYGSGRFVAISLTTNATYYSTNGRNWAVCKSHDGLTDIRANNVIYEDGRFWKIWQGRLAYSTDGVTWYDYHVWGTVDTAGTGQLGYPPLYIKKTGGYYFAFGRTSAANGRYYWYTRSLLTRPDSWSLGDTGQSNAGWQMTDVAMHGEMVIFAYGNAGYASMGINMAGSQNGTVGSFQLFNGSGDGSTGVATFYQVFMVGSRMFGVDTTNNFYEITVESDQRNATNTVYALKQRAWINGVWGTFNYYTHCYGPGAISARGDRIYQIDSSESVTFSVYNSTIPTVN
jgi:photosystem II stability/assembly factor-like uncharacterized protein